LFCLCVCGQETGWLTFEILTRECVIKLVRYYRGGFTSFVVVQGSKVSL